MSLVCTECSKEFSMKSNLTRHLRMIHNLHVERLDILPHEFDVFHYKCLEGCNISFKYNRELRNHLKTFHEISLVEENLEFPNREEFNKWLSFEESDNCVQYVHVTATKRKSTGGETYYYECNRTGKANRVDDNIRKRKPRKRGTHKLNRGCTSQIIVNKGQDGAYSVNYFKTHYGHDIEVEHVQLSKQDRGTIASRLLLGIPITNVMDSYRNNSSNNNSKRIKLLARKDILNIKSSFNISFKDGKSTNTNININNWVAECSQEEYDPVIYYKVQNVIEPDDICLIIMTNTQSKMLAEKANSNIIVIDRMELDNSDFELSTLFVVCEHNESFPGACMISNRKDEFIYELFFTKIQEKIGRILPQIFVSDISEIYYNSWRNIMGDVEYDFYNSWQIDLDWKRNLNKVCCIEAEVTKVKRKWVYDTLKILQNITDENEFKENLDETINLLEDDIDFKEFAEYFLKYYSDTKKWADCYRVQCNLLDAKQLEMMSEVLKQYVKVEKDIRFDKTFHAIIRFIRDETVNYITKNNAERNLLMHINYDRHLKSIKQQNILTENISDQIWNISGDNETVYIIQRHMLKRCCKLICSFCQICIHCFSCTCVDFFVNNTICQHIHYLWMKCFHSTMPEDEDNSKEQIIIQVQSDDDSISEQEENEEVFDNNIVALQNNVVQKMTVLATNITNLNNKETLEIILKNLDNLEQFVAESKDEEVTDVSQIVKDEETKKDNSVLSDHSYL